MRELKFRAWDTKARRMFAPFELKQKLNQRLGTFPVSTILLQYTGLKDKRGQEIYEGDIVHTEDSNFEVCFLENCWYLRRKFDGGVSFGRLNETWIEAVTKNLPYEVIGNIWESPELLKNDQDELVWKGLLKE